MTATNPPRGGKTGKSFAPRKTLYKDAKPPKLWTEYLAALRKFREDHGMTTREVATTMGVSIALISNWERGHSVPHPYDFCVYLETIGVTRIVPE